MKCLPLILVLPMFCSCTPQSGSGVDAEYQRQLDDFDRQTAETDRQLNRSKEQADRYDALLDRWEQQADRQDKIHDGLERFLSTQTDQSDADPANRE